MWNPRPKCQLPTPHPPALALDSRPSTSPASPTHIAPTPAHDLDGGHGEVEVVLVHLNVLLCLRVRDSPLLHLLHSDDEDFEDGPPEPGDMQIALFRDFLDWKGLVLIEPTAQTHNAAELSEYEKQRQARIEANQDMLRQLGLA